LYFFAITGKSSKSKVVAYLYQHRETEVMNMFRATVAQGGAVCRWPMCTMQYSLNNA